MVMAWLGMLKAFGVRANRGRDAQVVELGQVLFDRVAQSELALFGEHHDADRGDRLGHGHDLENGVLPHGMAGFDIGHAGRVELHDVAAVGDKGNGAGDGLLIDERLHPLRDLRQNFLIHAGGFALD